MEKALPWIIVGIVILVAFYLINQNKTTVANTEAITAAVVTANAPCVPFTKAQQDAEKRNAQAKCASKLLIPFVGPAQYTACMKNVTVSLTPISNC